MGRTFVQALFTLPTNDVDLPHHALTDPRGIVSFHHFAHELMPQDTSIWIISLDQFQICAADPSLADLDQSFVGHTLWRDVPQVNLIVLQPHSVHFDSSDVAH